MKQQRVATTPSDSSLIHFFNACFRKSVWNSWVLFSWNLLEIVQTFNKMRTNTAQKCSFGTSVLSLWFLKGHIFPNMSISELLSFTSPVHTVMCSRCTWLFLTTLSDITDYLSPHNWGFQLRSTEKKTTVNVLGLLIFRTSQTGGMWIISEQVSKHFSSVLFGQSGT